MSNEMDEKEYESLIEKLKNVPEDKRKEILNIINDNSVRKMSQVINQYRLDVTIIKGEAKFIFKKVDDNIDQEILHFSVPEKNFKTVLKLFNGLYKSEVEEGDSVTEHIDEFWKKLRPSEDIWKKFPCPKVSPYLDKWWGWDNPFGSYIRFRQSNSSNEENKEKK